MLCPHETGCVVGHAKPRGAVVFKATYKQAGILRCPEPGTRSPRLAKTGDANQTSDGFISLSIITEAPFSNALSEILDDDVCIFHQPFDDLGADG